MTAEYAVEQWCLNTSYPQQRAGAELLAAARVLAAVSRGDPAVMAGLMTVSVPPLEPAEPTGPVIEDLPGGVVSYRWPGRGGPPSHLLQPPHNAPAVHQRQPTIPTQAPAESPVVPPAQCKRCSQELPTRSTTRDGRPALYCSDRCRVAAPPQPHPSGP